MHGEQWNRTTHLFLSADRFPDGYDPRSFYTPMTGSRDVSHAAERENRQASCPGFTEEVGIEPDLLQHPVFKAGRATFALYSSMSESVSHFPGCSYSGLSFSSS